MNYRLPPFIWCILLGIIVFLPSKLAAQGGPPMLTDDPGTPGNNKWEINLVCTSERLPGATLYGLPLLDANYGVGDTLQLTYEAPYAILKTENVQSSGMGDSTLGVKWRFKDGNEHAWLVSTYPQLTLLNPGSNSDKRGLADSATTLLLPIEVQKDLGPVSLGFDFGHLFSTKASDRGWMGGFVIGKQLKKNWEIDAELHVNTDSSLSNKEVILNFGTRIDITEQLTFMLAIGRDLSNQLTPKSSLMTYSGFQLRL